jgi:site-specific recombinase XerD
MRAVSEGMDSCRFVRSILKPIALLPGGPFPMAEITLLIAVARSLRERAIIATLADAGLCNRELCRLRILNVDLGGQTLHVQAMKTQKDRYTHIAAPCVSLLAEYISERSGLPSFGRKIRCSPG